MGFEAHRAGLLNLRGGRVNAPGTAFFEVVGGVDRKEPVPGTYRRDRDARKDRAMLADLKVKIWELDKQRS